MANKPRERLVGKHEVLRRKYYLGDEFRSVHSWKENTKMSEGLEGGSKHEYIEVV